MTPSPLVSTVMSVYNGERFLAEAMASVLAQTFSDFEFVVVDDGSTDRTPQILEAYAAKDARIRVIRNSENLGLAASLNRGIEEASGDYIARMDSDDISLPTRFAEEVGFLQTHPEICLVATWYEFIDEAAKHLATPYLPDPRFLRFMEFNHIFHSSVMVRRACLMKVGGYDGRIRYREDKELWSRMVQAGCQFSFLPALLCQRRIWFSTMTVGETLRRGEGKGQDKELRAKIWVASLLSRHGEAPRARQLWREIVARSPFPVPRAWLYIAMSYLPRSIQSFVFWQVRVRLRYYARQIRRRVGARSA